MPKDPFQSIGSVLKDLMKRNRPMQSVGKELRIWEEWDKIVGPEIAKNARPQQLRGGVLFVETSHPLWSTELQYRSQSIVQKLNEALGKDLISNLHCRLGRF